MLEVTEQRPMNHSITQYISLMGTAVNEFYRMIRMGVAGHVRGNRTETNEY